MIISDPFAAEAADPISLFKSWLEDAKTSEPNDPNAMSLATISADGKPSVRIVLMKQIDERGFIFYTNRESRKGKEISSNSNVALCFHWKTKLRQVRVEGKITEVSSEEADDYFHSRARISQIGAWASQQSQPLANRATLEARTSEFEAIYPAEVPRPPYWTGFIVTPRHIEFWQDRSFRLHDRIVFIKQDKSWLRQRLYP